MDEDEKSEQEMAEIFKLFRNKCTELNLINAEMLAAEGERQKKYDAYRALYDEYLDYHSKTCEPISKQLMELRSEIQLLQAKLLDFVIEYYFSPRQPHEKRQPDRT